MRRLRSSFLLLVAAGACCLTLFAAASAVSAQDAPGFDNLDTPDTDPVYFKPSIYFPGLERLSTDWKTTGILVTPKTLGQYIVTLYKFFTGATAIVAMFMVTYGGLLWLLAGGNQGSISNAKEIITGAIAGMVIALLSYALLATISRGLVEFKSLDTRLEAVDGSGDSEFVGQSITCGSSGIAQITERPSLRLSGASEPCMRAENINALYTVADTIWGQRRYGLRVTSALRSQQRQAELFVANCKEACEAKYPAPQDWKKECKSSDCSGTPTCNPYRSECGHTQGNAVDVFCDNGEIWGECQRQLEGLMVNAGFCRLNTEAWHFEKPPRSAGCISSTPIVPPVGCDALTGEGSGDVPCTRPSGS